MNLFRKKSVDIILKQIEKDGADEAHVHLNKVLTVRDLTALGIAAIIGAGIFSTVGKACFDGGPAVIFLFMICAVACGFSALCYAEFASRIPVSGSAYTYSYAAFGELIAWIIGWDLIMEYAIGNITVAISWSDNLTSLLNNMGIHLPLFLTTAFFQAHSGYTDYLSSVATHADASQFAAMYNLWMSAPHIGSMPFIIDIPALLITALITYVVYVGIRESRNGSNMMVAFKLVVIILVIIVGAFYINPKNWTPFAPNGFSGIMRGVSAVFFAYIGFDAISTTAEECKNPQRDLPRGMFLSLIICTVLYILIALVLTGMVKYTNLNVGDFLASAFNQRGLNWIGGLVALSAMIATTSVLLVFQLGQPRIWMSMSRDGLLPPKFSALSKKHKTPWFATLITGLLVGIPSLFLDSNFVTDLTSIGTLFAFVLVCGGILVLPRNDATSGKFKIPYINGKYIVPAVFIAVVVLVQIFDPGFYSNFFSLHDSANPASSAWEVFRERFPYFVFVIIMIWITIRTYQRNYSIIPVFGLASCFYLMTELGTTNWLRFVIWLIIGLTIYFTYSYKNSRLGKEAVGHLNS